MNSRYSQPALLGGLTMGVLSALPIINLGNACCCLWVIAGGMVAAYVLQANDPRPIAAGDGAVVGLLAGLLGAVITIIVKIPFDLMMGPFTRRMFERFLENAQDMPDQMRGMFERMQTGQMRALGYIGTLFLMLCVGAVFSTLGGLLGAAIFKKKLPPSGTVPPPV